MQDASLTVDKVGDLTIEFVTTTIAEVDWSEPKTSPSPPQKDVIDKSLPLVPANEPVQVQRSASEQILLNSSSRPGVLGLFLRRKKEKHPNHLHDEPDVPPLAPPKDSSRLSTEQPCSTRPSTTIVRDPEQSTHYNELESPTEQSSGSLEVVVKPSFHGFDTMLLDLSPKHKPAVPELPTWPTPPLRTNKVSLALTPAEKALRRAEKQRQVEEDEKTALEAEAARRARLMKQKEESLKREEEEAEFRKAELEELVRQAMTERKKKEIDEMEAEVRKSAELEERKRTEREKRLEQTRQSEERRKERTKLAEELMTKEQRAQRQAHEERNSRIQLAKASVISRITGGATLAGWVTIQTSESLIWRRRHFQFVGSTWMFYRSTLVGRHVFVAERYLIFEQDTHIILDQIDLHNRVDSLREWYEGYEELKAIPNSFAIQFRDGQGSWSVFSDTEEEKVSARLPSSPAGETDVRLSNSTYF